MFTIALCLTGYLVLVASSRRLGARLPWWVTVFAAVGAFGLAQAALVSHQVSSVVAATLCVLGCEMGALWLTIRAVLTLLPAFDGPDEEDEGEGDDDPDDGDDGGGDPLEQLWRLPARRPLARV